MATPYRLYTDVIIHGDFNNGTSVEAQRRNIAFLQGIWDLAVFFNYSFHIKVPNAKLVKMKENTNGSINNE